MLSVTFVKCLM